MKDDLEEQELDRYIEQLDKKEIKVPLQLEAKILDCVDRVNARKRTSLHKALTRTFTGVAVVLLLFTVSVKWLPNFAAYASAIPVVRYAVDWIKGDSGTELAKKQGYSELASVTIQQNGYKLVLDNIMFDEDRLVLSAYAYGEKIEELLPIELDGTKPEPSISLKFLDFKEPGYIGLQHSPDDSKEKALKLRAEKHFEEKEVRTFLSGQPEYLSLSAELILRTPDSDPKVLQTFKSIKIPLDRSKILMSKIYEVKQNVQVDKAKITLDSLTISPTRMRVDVSSNLPEGFFFTNFVNPYLKDSKGNVYKPEGIVGTDPSETTKRLFFVPSLYFDDSHDQLYFGFDGILIGAEEGKAFKISMTDTYPKKLSYMGEEIIIEKVRYNHARDLDPLQIQLQLPRKLSIQGLDIEGSKRSSHGMTDSLDENGKPFADLFEIDVDYRPEYEVEFSFPGYLINGKKEIPIKLK